MPSAGADSQGRSRSPAHRAARAPGGAILAIACAAQFMGVLDASIVNVALPSIARSLHLTTTELQWVVTAYILPFAGCLLLGGRAADLFGHKRVFTLGLGLFTAASLAGATAHSGGWLIGARAAQGLGGAMLAPATLSLLTTTFTEPKARARAMGIWSSTAGSAGAFGVLAGGVLTGLAGWRWVLLINVPAGIALLAASLTVLTGEPVRVRGIRELDAPGAVAITAAITLLAYLVANPGGGGLITAGTGYLAGLAVAGFGLFLLIEARARRPLVPPRVIRVRALVAANVSAVLIGAAMLSAFFFLSLYVQFVLGYPPLTTGIALLPNACCIVAGATLAGRMAGRTGPRPLLWAGTLCAAAGLAWMGQAAPGTSFVADLLAPSMLLGLGIGLAMVPMTIAAMSGLGRGEQGLGSGLVNTSRQCGAVIGLAALTSIAAAVTRGTSAGAGTPPARAALSAGYDRAFLGAAILMAAAAVAASALRPTPPGAAQPAGPAGPGHRAEVTTDRG